MTSQSHVAAGSLSELVAYIILFLLAQVLIFYLSRWIKNHIAGRNQSMLKELLARDVRDLLDLRSSMKARKAWDAPENRWLAALINKAIHMKVQKEVVGRRRNAIRKRQLAQSEATRELPDAPVEQAEVARELPGFPDEML